MSLVSFSLILTGVLLNAAAQLLLKAGTNHLGHFEFSWENLWPIGLRIATELPILAGLGCYAISVVVWILALSRVPVSQAYPLLSIGYVVNAIAAWALLGETLTSARISGIFVILVGVYLIAR
ncbi:MAG: EamA family transporter [Ferrovum sp.]|jgi:multidrug transporter EmrE-like cation transporter|nr:EamA family transporter [Ferrovum sp.]NDU87652.1 EamA family transporter [Ferrovum sp.]